MTHYGHILTGNRAHYCPELDDIPIDETVPEYEDCCCFGYDDPDESAFSIFAIMAMALTAWVALMLWLTLT